jgi:hypothetical protein
MSLSRGMVLKGFGPSGGGVSLLTPTLAVVDNGDGTITATITGSTSGTTNTLLYQTNTGAFGGVPFLTAGSRTGDGTIADVTIPAGYYWWQVVSAISPDSVPSNVVYQSVASQSDPVHLQCCNAVQAVIQSLALAGVASSSVVVKKIAVDRILGTLKANGITLPAVLIIPESETQDPTRGNNNKDDVIYPVLAILVEVDNQEQTLSLDLPATLKWRQTCSRSFRQQRLTGVPIIIDATVQSRSIADPNGWSAGYYVSALSFRFTSREIRGFGT